MRTVFPFHFIFNASAFFSCQVKAQLQADHVFVSVCLSFYACLRLYQLHGGKKKCRMHRATTSIVKLFHKSASKLLAYSTEQYYNDCSANREAVFSSVALSFFFITFEARGNTSCLCVVFRVTLYLKKKCG